MRTALQIKPEVNIRLESLRHAGRGEVVCIRTTTRPDYEVNPDDCNDGDDDYTREKVLFLHCRILALLLSYSDEPRVPPCGLTSLFSLSIDVRYGGTRHLED